MNVREDLNAIDDCLYRVAVKAVVIKDQNVLLVKDNRDKGWCFPGGGVDHGEKLSAALRRELAEEIGINESDVVSNDKIVSVFIGHEKSGIPRCNIHFVASLKTLDLQPTQEIVTIKWAPISDIEDYEFDLSSGDRDEILKLIHTLNNSAEKL